MARKKTETEIPIDPEGGWDTVVAGGLGGPLYQKAGKLHRLNGPAVTWVDGTELWYIDGQLHRDGGPAVTRPDGSTEFWKHGQRTDVAPERPEVPDESTDAVISA